MTAEFSASLINCSLFSATPRLMNMKVVKSLNTKLEDLECLVNRARVRGAASFPAGSLAYALAAGHVSVVVRTAGRSLGEVNFPPGIDAAVLGPEENTDLFGPFRDIYRVARSVLN